MIKTTVSKQGSNSYSILYESGLLFEFYFDAPLTLMSSPAQSMIFDPEFSCSYGVLVLRVHGIDTIVLDLRSFGPWVQGLDGVIVRMLNRVRRSQPMLEPQESALRPTPCQKTPIQSYPKLSKMGRETIRCRLNLVATLGSTTSQRVKDVSICGDGNWGCRNSPRPAA